MTTIKLNKFLGEAPKLDAELLPNSAAQVASNVKLYSGDLLPYNQSSLQSVLVKTGPIQTIYPMDDGVGGFKWLHWASDVDVVRAPVPNNASTQRVYYTGDTAGNGEPKATTYSLATTGASTAYPYAYYTLGLPAPVAACSAALTSGNNPLHLVGTVGITSIVGGTGSVVTVTTVAAHGLNTGAYVTIAGFLTTYTSFNVTNAQITVTGSTTFTYFANGTAGITATTGMTTLIPTLDLTGLQLARTYVYTWLTAWGEESAPAPTSNSVYVYEGSSVTVTGLPSSFPTTGAYAGGVYQTTGMLVNVYRTVTSTTGTTYYLAGQVSLGTTSFVDTQPLTSLTTTLPSATWFPPPVGLKGIRAIHNNMLVGFTGTTVCFSEPGQPHSWPTKYYQEIGRTVIAVGSVGTTVIVLTDANPWIIQGNTPTAMQKVRMDSNLPCVSKRGMVNMDDGLYFPTRGGIAVFSLLQGASLVTNYVYDWDNFRTQVDPTTITATRYNNKYMASHSLGNFIFEKDQHTGGFLVETSQSFSAVFYNPNTAKLYYAIGTPAAMYLWDDIASPYQNFDWKSRVIRAQDFINLGAARVISTFDTGPGTLTANAALLASNVSLISNSVVGGAIAGNGNRFGPSPTGTQNDIGAAYAGVPLAGSRLKPQISLAATLQFYLYTNGNLAFAKSLTSDAPFRLPTGYRTDKFEVRITGNASVRAVQLAETMQELKKS